MLLIKCWRIFLNIFIILNEGIDINIYVPYLYICMVTYISLYVNKYPSKEVLYILCSDFSLVILRMHIKLL